MNQFAIYDELIKRGITLDKHGDVKNFNPNYFPKYIKENYQMIFAKDKSYYSYNNGVWEIQEEEKLLKELREILQEPKFGVWTPSIERDYMIGMMRELYYEGDLNAYKNLINLINGMFNTENYTLIPHDMEYYSTIRIPIELNLDVDCSRWKEFLVQVFEGDEERINVAQEWAGYMLTPETKAQKALILLGEGENGKGVFIDTISEVIGEENISNIPLMS